MRRKVLWITAATLVAVTALLYLLSREIVLGSFSRLEEQDVRQNVGRVKSALARDLAAMNSTARDWAAWDDTYTFIADANSAYIADNMMNSTLTNLHLAVMLFVAPSGNVVYGKAVDLQSEIEVPFPVSLTEHLAAHPFLYRHTQPLSSIAGLILLPEGPMLIVSRPIVTSDDRGPIRGALIIGRYLDAAESQRLAETVHLSVEIYRLDDPQLPPDLQTAQASLQSKDVLVQPVDHQRIAGYTLLDDVYGHPILALRIDQPRTIYAQGQLSLRYFVAALLAAELFIGAVVLAVVERQFLTQLTHISERLGAANAATGLEGAAPVAAQPDELSAMVDGIDRALEALQQRERELTTLYEAATAINSDVALNTVLQTVATQTSHALRSSGCAISVWHQNRGTIETLVDHNRFWPEETDPPGTMYDLSDYPATLRVLQTGQPLLVQRDDETADPNELQMMEEQDVHTMLMLPLIAGDQTIGLVEVIEDTRIREYTPAEIRLAESLAAHAAMAIEKARLYEQARREIIERRRAEELLREYATRQEVLYTIAMTATTTLDPDTLLPTALDVTLRALKAEAGWVILPGPAPDAPARVAARRGPTTATAGVIEPNPLRSCPIYTPPSTTEAARGEPRLVISCPQLPAEVRSHGEMCRHVCIPLSAGDRTLGVLIVAWYAAPPPAIADDTLLLTIGRHIGVALQNAQLHQTARQVDRLQVLNKLDAALAATLNPDTVAEITLHHAATALDAQRGLFFPLPPHISNTSCVRMLALQRGWVESSIAAESQARLEPLLQRLQLSREAFLIPGEELTTLSEHRLSPQRWGPEGLIVPIWGEGRLVAALALGGRTEGQPFRQEDRELAQAMASRAGQAIENARLYQTSQEQAVRLATLNDISAAAVSSLELNTMLRQVLHKTCLALNAAEGSVLLREPGMEGLFIAVTTQGDESGLHGQRLPPGIGIANWAAEHDQSICVNDTQSDARWHGGIDVITGLTTHSLLCAPIRHHGQVVGVIEIINKQSGEFTAADLSLLESISAIVAAALENTRLFMATRAYVDELKLLNEIGLVLTSTLDPPTIIRAALNQIQRLFRAECVSLLQPHPETGGLQFVQTLRAGSAVAAPLCLAQGKGIAGWSQEHREPVLVEDAQSDPRHTQRVDRHLGLTVRALMVAPLLMRDKVSGVIEVASSEAAIYANSHLKTLQAIASTMAVALENAHLYQELKALLRERAETQAQLIHSEKMAALGRLLTSLAHEINNPLQALRSGMRLLLKHQFEEEKRQQYLEVAAREVERLIATVERVLGFYRPSVDQPERLNVNTVLEETLVLAGRQLEQSHIAVRSQLDSDLPAVQIAPDQLKQVMLNIILNAQQAMPAGGELELATTWDPAADEVRIAFKDTGEGIPQDKIVRVFEPFFTTRRHGSGLGLAISYAIVQQHGGRIEVHSQEGAGSTFTVVLPAASAHDDALLDQHPTENSEPWAKPTS